MPSLARSVLILFAVLPLAASAAEAPGASAGDPKSFSTTPEAVRAAFKDAMQHAAQSAPQDPPALQDYVLYPYLEAARLRSALSAVKPGARDAEAEARIRKFLDREGKAPATYDLRRDWLLYLGSRAAWAEFRADAPVSPDDPAVQCYLVQARLATGDLGGVHESALALWLSSRIAPPQCDPVFAWLDQRERLSDGDIQARALVAIGNRQPLPQSLKELPPDRQAVLKFWRDLAENPERGLRKFIVDGPPKDFDKLLPDAANEPLLDAFGRVARRSAAAATPLFDKLIERKAFSDDDRAQLRLSYAVALAMDHEPEAVAQFERVPDKAFDPNAREWRMRAALYQQNWQRVLDWEEAMPPFQRAEPRWRYFRARALERLERKDEARALYADVAGEREYYGFLAAERLERKPDLAPRALAEDKAAQKKIAAMAPMQRARELLACDLRELASAELRYALRDLGAARPQAALVAASWGWYDAAVQLASDLQKWDDLWLRYPLPYDAEVAAAAKASGLPGDWIYAVLRTESLYNPRAVSSADALGLLQVRLKTARYVAKRDGLPKPERDDLFRPDVNLQLGARYLRELHEKFGSHWIYTLAGYNAGPQHVPEWVPKHELPADAWVENLPYAETRTYVQRVLSSLVVFGWRRTGVPAVIAPWLTEAGPLREGVRPWTGTTRDPNR
jgi:soluble lytic murein transglycosylase